MTKKKKKNKTKMTTNAKEEEKNDLKSSLETYSLFHRFNRNLLCSGLQMIQLVIKTLSTNFCFFF